MENLLHFISIEPVDLGRVDILKPSSFQVLACFQIKLGHLVIAEKKCPLLIQNKNMIGRRLDQRPESGFAFFQSFFCADSVSVFLFSNFAVGPAMALLVAVSLGNSQMPHGCLGFAHTPAQQHQLTAHPGDKPVLCLDFGIEGFWGWRLCFVSFTALVRHLVPLLYLYDGWTCAYESEGLSCNALIFNVIGRSSSLAESSPIGPGRL